MLILAIETSCDETAAAVVRDGRFTLSSTVASQMEEHRLYGGVVPEIASRRHAEALCGVTGQALDTAGVSLAEIDAVAVTFAPGLIGALLCGVNFAKGLAFAAAKPLVPVHHIKAHIAANYLAHSELTPPFLCLTVSGGHTQIVEVPGYTEFRTIGRTRDDAAGECFDKTARALGLPYPGGVFLDKLADSGVKSTYALPSPKVEGAPYDFSFSGLKTACLNIINNAAQMGKEVNKADLAAALRARVCDLLIDKTLAAAGKLGCKTVVACGGVSANSELRRRFPEECERRGLAFFAPPPELCGDNAAMVGAEGYYEFLAGVTADAGLNALAAMPI
ncbi:MAG: tRNA (adenosine(37)-N6)-threonylcarbamoyltransferase complex transferase subunit TsaD [Oscillospiraceae bacterium]|nr:tRNA (adenosine(37)-N6)-threonylcarbamoyltransferase complex transferase subunit TsaD [Oscillospiraceae bacterium]